MKNKKYEGISGAIGLIFVFMAVMNIFFEDGDIGVTIFELFVGLALLLKSYKDRKRIVTKIDPPRT